MFGLGKWKNILENEGNVENVVTTKMMNFQFSSSWFGSMEVTSATKFTIAFRICAVILPFTVSQTNPDLLVISRYILINL